jgi:hypothetical protein
VIPAERWNRGERDATALYFVILYAPAARALHACLDNKLAPLIEVSTKSLSNEAEEEQSDQSAAQSTAAEFSQPPQALLI